MGSLSNIEFSQTSVEGNATKAKTNIDSKNKKESTRSVIIINEIYTGWQTIEYFSRQTNIYIVVVVRESGRMQITEIGQYVANICFDFSSGTS